MATLQRDRASVQKKTFTKWCNSQLSRAKQIGVVDPTEYMIEDLEHDLRDGIRLIHLLEVLSGESLPRERPVSQRGTPSRAGSVMRIYKIVNVDKALKFLRNKLGDPLENIGSEDIVDGNLKLTLGLVWILISSFRIKSIGGAGVVGRESIDGRTSTEAGGQVSPQLTEDVHTDGGQPDVSHSGDARTTLLAWCNQILAPYIDIGILPAIKDFGPAWQNGIAFLCLVHFFDHRLVPEITELTYRGTGQLRTQQRIAAHDSYASPGNPTNGNHPSPSTFPSLGQGTNPRTRSGSSTSSGGHLRNSSVSSLTQFPASPPMLSQVLTPPPSPTPSLRSSHMHESFRSSSGSSGHGSASPALARYLYTSDPEDWIMILNRAFFLAEQYMGVAELFDAADLAGMETVDERVVMTYVSELYWVLRDRPAPSPTAFRPMSPTPAPTKPLPEPPRSTAPPPPARDHIAAKLTEYLSKADQLTNWLHTRQQEFLRIAALLCSTPADAAAEAGKPNGANGGWAQKIIDILFDDKASLEQLKYRVGREVGKLKEEVEMMIVGDHLPSDHSGEGSVGVGGRRGGRRTMISQLEVLREEIAGLVHEALAAGMENVPDASAVEETHRRMMVQVQNFVNGSMPACVDQVLAFVGWVEGMAGAFERVRGELYGAEGEDGGGLKEEVNRVRKEIKGVGREMRLALVEESKEAADSNALKAKERIEMMKAVVVERLGGATVQDWVTDVDTESIKGDDTKSEFGDAKTRLTLAELFERLEGEITGKVEGLQKQIGDIKGDFETYVKSPPADSSEDIPPASMASFTFTPTFISAATSRMGEEIEAIALFIAQEMLPALAARKAQVNNEIKRIQLRKDEEERREKPLKEEAVRATEMYCVQVGKIDMLVKQWREEMAMRTRKRSGEDEEVRFAEMEQWWEDRNVKIKELVEGSAMEMEKLEDGKEKLKPKMTLARLDVEWKAVVDSATTGLEGVSTPLVPVPHHSLKKRARTLMEAMDIFRIEILDAAKGKVEERREALVNEWEGLSKTVESEVVFSSLTDADRKGLVAAVDEWCEAFRHSWWGVDEQKLYELELTSVVEKETAAIADFEAGWRNVSGKVEDSVGNLRKTVGTGNDFDEERWPAFMSKTESIIKVVGLNLELRHRVTKRYEGITAVVQEAKQRREKDLAELQACLKKGQQASEGHVGPLERAVAWLKSAVALESELQNSVDAVNQLRDGMESTEERLLDVDRGYNSAYDDVEQIETRIKQVESTLQTHFVSEIASLRPSLEACKSTTYTDSILELREALFSSYISRLENRRGTIADSLSALWPRFGLLRILEEFSIEAAYTLGALRRRIELEQQTHIPHGLDDHVSETVFSRIGDEISKREEQGRAWQEVLRRAKVEQASERYFAAVGEHPHLADDRVAGILRSTVALVRELDEQVLEAVAANKAKISVHLKIMRDVRAYGSKALNAAAALDSDIDGLKIRDTELEVLVEAKLVTERLKELDQLVHDVGLNAHGIEDERVKGYVQELEKGITLRQERVDSIACGVVRVLVKEWEEDFANPAAEWCTSMQTRLKTSALDRPTSGEDAGANASVLVYAVEGKHSAMLKSVGEYEGVMGQFERKTEMAVRALREFSVFRKDADDEVKWRPDTVQSRYVQSRSQFEEIDRMVHDGIECAREGAKLLEEIAVARQTMASIEDSIMNEDDEEEYLDILEQRLTDLERVSINDHLGAALDEMNSLPAASSIPQDHILIAQACGRRFESLLNHAQKVRALLVGRRRTKSIVDDYLKQAAEVAAWVAARIENLESVDEDATNEAKRVLKLEPTEDDDTTIVSDSPLTDATIIAAAGRTSERETHLVNAAAALERYGRAYEHLQEYAARVIESCGDNGGVADAVQKQQEEVNAKWEEMGTQLEKIRHRIQRQGRIFRWSQKCRMEVETGVEALIAKLEGGSLFPPVELLESGDVSLSSYSGVAEEKIKVCEVEIKGWRDIVEQTGEEGLAIIRDLDTEARAGGADYDFTAAIQDRDAVDFVVKRGQGRLALAMSTLQDIFQNHRSAMQTIGALLKDFCQGIEETEPWVEESIRALRDRLHRSHLLFDEDDSEEESDAASRYLMITGAISSDEKNLAKWTESHDVLVEKLRNMAATKVTETTEIASRLATECESLDHASLGSVRNMVREHIDTLNEKWREADRLANEETAALARTQKYIQVSLLAHLMEFPTNDIDIQFVNHLQWHEQLSQIDSDVQSFAGRLQSVADDPAKLDDAFFEEADEHLRDHDRKLDEFIHSVDQDRQKLTTVNSPKTPTPPSPLDAQATNERRRRKSVVSVLNFSNYAEEENGARLKERQEALASQVVELRSSVAELRVTHENWVKSQSLEEALSKVTQWGEGLIESLRGRCRALPPQELLDWQNETWMRGGEDASEMANRVQNALKAAIKAHTSTMLELSQQRNLINALGLQVGEDKLKDVQRILSRVESFAASESSRLEDTKRLFAHDRASVNILTWLKAAWGAANVIVETQRHALVAGEEDEAALADLAATYEEVSEFEDRLGIFQSTIAGFFDLAQTAKKEVSVGGEGGHEEVALVEAFRSAVDAKTDMVRREWDKLNEVVQGLRGSSLDRARELQFTGTVDQIYRVLEEAKAMLTALAQGEADDPQRVYHDVEYLLDETALPLVLSLKEKAETCARSPAEKNRYLQQQRNLQEQLNSFFEFVESRRINTDNGTLQRRFARLANEVEDMIAEFSKIVQTASEAATAASAAAVGIALPAGGRAPPTDAECEALATNLDRRFSFYNVKITNVLARMEPAGRHIGGGPKQRELTAKWEGTRAWSDGVKDELLHRLRTRKAAKKSGLPAPSRRPSIGTNLPRFAAKRPTQNSISPQTPSQTPTHSHWPPPSMHVARSPSPAHSVSSVSSIPRASPTHGSRTSSASPAAAATPTPPPPRHPNMPVRIYLPSPNNYVPNSRDPLDVQVARIVNSHPSVIRVERTNEPGRYWFGEALPRLCFCRLLRDRAVMVRVGGGWQPLAEFLTEHSTLEHRIPTIRSFAPADEEAPEGANVIELTGGDVNPYNLASKLPKWQTTLHNRRS
ncbi:Spectrin beta chain, non-erythrocytic 4 [Rhizophlyctis rosea]|nr:Spectrin beta chain, non-erythrocytic 4 [Rhizophlyctis rosea]